MVVADTVTHWVIADVRVTRASTFGTNMVVTVQHVVADFTLGFLTITQAHRVIANVQVTFALTHRVVTDVQFTFAVTECIIAYMTLTFAVTERVVTNMQITFTLA